MLNKQAKVWCFVRVPNKPSKGAGLSYNQKLGALVLWWCGAGGVMRVLSKQDKVVKLGAGLSKQG